QRDELLKQIEGKRAHLRDYPASCAARQRRDFLFLRLYDLMSLHWGWSRDQVDARYRTLEDYVYAPLDYTRSRTCCWDSSSHAMHEQIMAYAQSLQEGMCTQPPVFKQTDGSYGAYAEWAQQHDAPFPTWRADEACPQASQLTDVEQSVGY